MKNKAEKSETFQSSKKIHDTIIGSCRFIEECRNLALRIAGSDAPVLITGESGTGKELFADLIQKNSSRRDRPYIKINCAAIPESLIETELFGHVKGSFTDAVSDRAGKFISADTGTIFLDEIFDLPLHVQSKILRIIETGIADSIGSDRPTKIDVRIISATNRDIDMETGQGRFRKELYYRLNVLKLKIPPLRERKEDIPELIDYFTSVSGYSILFETEAIDKIMNYRWPGNVRELENFIKKLGVLKAGKTLDASDIDLDSNDNFSRIPLKTAINNFKKKYIMDVLIENDWNKSRSAAVLGIQRTYLSRLISELGINGKDKE